MTVLSTLRLTKGERAAMQERLNSSNLIPAIPFYPPYKKIKEESETPVRKKRPEVREFKVPMDWSEDDSVTYEYFINVFENGSPTEYCQMREKIQGLFKKYGYDHIGQHEDDELTDAEIQEQQADRYVDLLKAVLKRACTGNF